MQFTGDRKLGQGSEGGRIDHTAKYGWAPSLLSIRLRMVLRSLTELISC
jgi:hypothetical protein